MSLEIPYVTFTGNVIQLETDFPFPAMRELFEPCFSSFLDLEARNAAFKSEGIETLATAAGVEVNFGFRPRRFAGGPGLPSGRYFTVCEDETLTDHGTLRDELTAYYGGESGITVTIFDPKVDTYMLEQLRSSGRFTDEDLRYPMFYLIYTIERPTEKNAPLLRQFKVGERVNMTYGLRQFRAQMPKVVDLRDPDTQAWFLETFVRLELESEKEASAQTQIYFLPKQPIESFAELLPVLVSLGTGGGTVFGQAIGQWLRRAGANGLVFPSARSNAFNRVEDGRSIASGGWNLVLYPEAEPPFPDLLFGRMSTWGDPDHDHIKVTYQADGPQKGSFSIRGAREFNLFDFDLEKQVAGGVLQEDPAAVLTGTRNAFLSHSVNAILEGESRKRSIWYHDVDYIDFTTWLERRWRPRPDPS